MTWAKSSVEDTRVTTGAQAGGPIWRHPRSFRANRPKHVGRSLASRPLFMRPASAHDLYSPAEIARAAGVSEADVVAALGYGRELISHAEAVRLGRMLVQRTSRCGSGQAPRRGSGQAGSGLMFSS